ncbi:HSP20 family protein [Orenia metallireducens]|uniref:HSP20 family protein n=1 Tax=Orenia metallireducens TaxID=1413210 RepID=A0A285H1U5_9FIRM|nr:hypothetical protein [Orenia metallireducens]PRX29441.1 HSP20 family protein [Orenia metallireducens]SNY29860.1 HSP20 family protein [Orenia metallireducens]
MKTKTWQPFSEINTLRNKINLFADESRIEYSKMADPTVDIYEEGKSLIARISLGNVDIDTVEISISAESIIINSTDRDTVIKSLSLPVKVDNNQADIRLEEGMAKISIPIVQ